MRTRLVCLLTAVCLVGPAVAQAPAETKRVTEQMFAANLPVDWRTMTPDEMFTLEDSLPYLMRVTNPGWYYSVGAVDRWLETGFDGRALCVSVQSGEIPIEQSSIDTIRESWAEPRDGVYREFVSGEISTLGKDEHPVIECRLRSPASGSIPAIEALEFYVPTSGHLLILSFRSWQDDFDQAAPIYRRIADSMTFPRPPRGAEELSDRLFDAAIIGGLVGLALIIIRMMVRRPTKP